MIILLTILPIFPMAAQPTCSVRTFTVSDGLPSNSITAIRQDCHDLIWIATWNGLCCYDGHRFTSFLGDEWGGENSLSSRRIAAIEPDSIGNIWVRTYDSEEYLFDTHQCRYFRLEEPFNGHFAKKAEDKGQSPAEQYINEHNIGKHLIDRQGNLWFISPQGLSLVNFHHPPIRLLPLEKEQQTRAVVCRRDGSVWAGARGGTLVVFNSYGQLISRRLFAKNMYAMHEDRQRNLWIGTRGDGLYVIRADGRTTGHYIHSNDPYSISHNDIYDIEEDGEGNIWIATWGGGLNMIEMSGEAVADRWHSLRFLHKGNDMKGYPKEGFDKVRRITHDGRETMIASTTWGLMTFAGQNGKDKTWLFHTTKQVANDTTSLRTNDVMQVLVCRNGTIYVTTMGGNIQQIVSDNLLQDSLRLQTVKAMNQGRGNALSMIEDRQGNIWIVREAQVNCYDVKTGRLEQFGPNSMSEQTELTEAKPAADSNGNVWLGAVGGVMTFNAGQMSKSSFRPNIVFTGIRYQGEQQERPILNRHTLYIADREQRSLTIAFAALDYGDSFLMQYAYKLKETDRDWNYIGHEAHIAFSQLPPGRHTLVVRSTNCDGVWMDNDTEIVLDVKPMLWERTWVRLLTLLLAVSITIWGVISWIGYRRKTREREQRMESILEQYQREEAGGGLPEHKYKLAEPQIVNDDEVMMNRLMAFIEERIGDETLKIEQMAEAVGMSRTVFYEKIRELVGLSPSDFLRQLRMQRARQLVSNSRMPFAQVAYSVGFTDPKYFTKCFKKDTGMTPSEFRASTGCASDRGRPTT